MNQNENLEESGSDEEILEVALKRFKLAEEAWSEIYKEASDDLKFSNGEQWDPQIKQQREEDRRPCLTINRLGPIVHQITNDQRQNRPAIKVSPVDDNADIETAKIIQGLARHVEHSSDADNAYDTAFDRAVRAKIGFFRIITDYVDPMSFDQEPRFKRVPDPSCVLLDPHFREPDGSDANWGFVFEDLAPDDFNSQFPDAEISKSHEWSTFVDQGGWIKKESARVAEYFYKEYKSVEICLLSNGQVIEKSRLPKAPGVLPEGISVKAERRTKLPYIKWCKLYGKQILEKTDWLGQWIPIVPVLGEELIIDGKRVLNGIISQAKDPQRMINYWKSAETEAIALAPKAPFIMAEGQDEGYEYMWAQANIKNFSALKYKPVTIGGQPVAPPQRNAYEPAVAAITNAGMYASDDLKASTGVYDAALGAKSNETSGKAIERRNNQSQTANFHFVDNLTKSIRHGGRILVDLFPKLYDAARAVRILGEDGSEEIVKINEMFEHNGKQVEYNLAFGKYDVSVDTGPNFATKRQEAVASQIEMSRANPKIMDVAGDIIVGNMDWPGAKDISQRLKKTLPPGIADDKDKQKSPIPPEVQAQMQQMNQMIEQLTGQVNEAHDVLDNKKLELESRERIEMAKLQVQLEIKMAEMGSKEGLALLGHEVAEIQQRLSMLNMSQPIETENEPMVGPDQALPTDEFQQPTGGQSPGQPMGV